MLDGIDRLELGDELTWEPMRIVPPDPWTGHLAFAFWLVRRLRPDMVVELGTHSANSYFAFCQAMAATTPLGRAFAVDTWAGDEHAGHYGEDVFAGVSAFNNAHFLAFSTLLRTTFDDARPYFADGSIDLLHIDGMHTYEAVRHDFDLWSPALSARGVVLFHDTNVRERNFGVWRLWQELSGQHPSFEFYHSNGLGVLGVGHDLPPTVRALFELSKEDGARFRSRVAARGEAFQRVVQAQNLQTQLDGAQAHIHDLAGRIASTVAEAQAAAAVAAHDAGLHADALRWRDAVIARNDQRIGAQAEVIAAYNRAITRRDAALAERDRLLGDRDGQIAAQSAGIASLDAELGKLRAETERLRHASEEEGARLRNEVQQMLADRNRAVAAEVHRAQQDIISAYNRSTSWRLTAPVRQVVRLVTGRPPALMAPAGPPPAAPPVSEIPVAQPPAPHPDPEAAAEPEPGNAAKNALRVLLASRLRAFLSTPQRLRLPSHPAPQVSILLVLYNQAELTFACLGSIIETLGADAPGIEVIIVDNASSDETGALLDRLDGVRIVRNKSNLHFLKGVNQAARLATGTHLLLLNNDAQLMPGAVQAALETLEADDGIGAVGGRIILPDGTLQEAGSIVWSDGACSGYGRGRNPDDPEFMFARDVDYCSGAFLLTPRAVFEGLGGLDDRFSPAYYEETDYCLRIWESGRRVRFDPVVAVVHLEFGSSVSSAAALALQARNRQTFVEQHRAWLAQQYPPSPLNALPARVARSRAKRVLVIEDRLPKPELGAGYPRASRIVRELADSGAEVTFFPVIRYPETWPDVYRTFGPGVEHFVNADGSQIRRFLESRPAFYDAILVCRPHNMELFLDAVGGESRLLAGVQVIYDAEAIFATRRLQELEAQGMPASEDEVARLVAHEVGLTRTAAAVISVNGNEQRIFEEHGVKTVHILGHALDEEPVPGGFDERTQIVFLGAMPDDNAPNAKALCWFATEILPLLRAILGSDIRLTVVGLAAAPSIRALDGIAFDLVGQIKELGPAMRHARVMVVPSRVGAGIPHKVHQAATMGIPMVVTGLIQSQLGWDAGQEVLVADDAAGFAAACARLYNNRELWTAVRDRALDRVRREADPARFRATVRAILDAVPMTHRVRDPEQAPAWEPDLLAAPPPPAAPDVTRDAGADWAMAVPFDYAPAQPAAPPSIGVMLHMFYPDLAPEMLYYLRNIPAPADLFISTDTEEKKARLDAEFAGWSGGAVTVRLTPNRGRDIAPKLVGFADAHGRYDRVLHLHSKVSNHAPFLAPWRSFLLENLLGSPFIVRSVFEAFDRLPDLGIVLPQHFEAVRRWLGWNGNFPGAKALAERMGITLLEGRALDFPSGSMFWARPAALQPLLDLKLRFEDFPDEGAQLDHTPAHAIERLYLHACERSGHTWLKIAQPALYVDTRFIAPIDSPSALGQFTMDHGVLLSGQDPIPVRAGLPPMMTTVPPGLAQALAARDL